MEFPPNFRFVGVGAMLAIGTGAFGWLAWFAEPVTVPRVLIFIFLLAPAGDVQKIISLVFRYIETKLWNLIERNETPETQDRRKILDR